MSNQARYNESCRITAAAHQKLNDLIASQLPVEAGVEREVFLEAMFRAQAMVRECLESIED